MGRDTVVRSVKLAQRRRSVRREERRRRRRITIGVAGAVAAAAGAWLMTGTSVFAIAEIQVVGASVVDETAVIRASGLAIGDSAMSGLTEAAARVEAMTDVRAATVERDGVVVRIAIEERRPVLAVRAGSRSWVVDRDGRPFVGAGEAEGLPVVVALDGPAAPGRPLRERTASGIARIWNSLSERDRARVETFSVSTATGVAFTIGATEVRMGEPTRIEAKLDALRLVRREVRGRGTLVVLDLRAPNRPAAVIR